MVPFQIPDQIPHQADLVRVEPDCRLVEDEQVRLVNHRVGEADPLAVAFREPPDDFFLHVAQAAQFEDIPDPFVHPASGNTLDRRAVAEILVHPHVRIQRDILRKIPDVLARPERLAENIPPGHFRAPGGRRKEAGQDLHRRALPRPVRPEETDDLAFGHLEINRVHSLHRAVTLCQLLHFDHRAALLRSPFLRPPQGSGFETSTDIQAETAFCGLMNPLPKART